MTAIKKSSPNEISTGLPDKPGDHRQWGNVHNGNLPWLLSNVIVNDDGFILVLAEDNEQALMLEGALDFYLNLNPGGKEVPAQNRQVMALPDWETLPYDQFSPHESIISQRLETLAKLPFVESGVLIIPANTLLHRLPPTSYLQQQNIALKTGQKLRSESFQQRLDFAGYRRVENVYAHGEYAIRGAILDVFPMGSEFPLRIEFFDDEVESLRTFDPETQRSADKISQFSLLPANEFPWDAEARQGFMSRWFDYFPQSDPKCPIFDDVKNAIKPAGVEYYSPLFFDHMESLFHYLPANTRVFTPSKLDQQLDVLWQDIDYRYEEHRHDIQRPIVPPEKLFLKTDEVFAHLKAYPRVSWHHDSLPSKAGRLNLDGGTIPDIAIDDRASMPLGHLQTFLMQYKDMQVLLCAESPGRKQVIAELLKQYQLPFIDIENDRNMQPVTGTIQLIIGQIDKGFVNRQCGLIVIAESELYGRRVMQRRRRSKSGDQAANVVKNLTELNIGDPVVHIDNGVGRYTGLQTIEVDGQTNEFVTLEYADNARLYVPVTSLHLISRYSGTDPELAPMHKLGSEKWSAAKKKALEKIRDTAADLLRVYAEREAKSGFACQLPKEAYRAFCANFPFEETQDQMEAIQAVIGDMTRKQPMDRLVCGDVGFGKTEVAMRAAFIACYSGKQVAVLVPTTLLAQQHYESFQDRFADTPVKIEILSRFKSATEQQAVQKRMESGQSDIVIGTHKLLQKDMRFKDLGLLIIDEEHRFGVQQKEKLKSYRAQVDILTLTATPIPRTLNMAMGGIRDLSIIATPPARRLSIKTFVQDKQEESVKEAILREVLRGGQVYYLHNEVKSIEKTAAEIRALFAEAKVGVAHGQMREKELEQVMSDFYHKRFNILVCTTIIETGIDVPNANTIIIERADKFGLAQLHQLRGRVGRSHHQAYAYLLKPEHKKLTRDAEKRLDAISASQDLGAGFMLASHDLEIRGAGELLGEEQSGQIQNIGFTLYMDLLEKAVKSLQQGKEFNLEESQAAFDINLRIPAIIPEDYVPDIHSRLILYKRIANTDNKDQLNEIQIELIDRFGLLPEPVKNLIRQTELKFRAEAMGIKKLDAGARSGVIEFNSAPNIDPLKLVQLVQQRPDLYQFKGGTQLKFTLSKSDADGKLQEIGLLLDKIGNAA